MSSDGESKPLDQDRRPAGTPSVLDESRSSRGIPLTTIGLCGLAMILVGGRMERASAGTWWAWLALASVLILILYMWMWQERWLTRERHRLIMSALKRTGALYGSRESEEKVSRRARTRRGGKPVEKGSSQRGQAEPPRLSAGGVPPDSPHAPDRGVAREEVPPTEMKKGMNF